MSAAFDAIQFPIAVDVDRGELTRVRDLETYLAQLVRQVLLTAPGERINRPTFGAGIGLVFAPTSAAVTAPLLESTIRDALTTWLGTYIRVERVTAAVGMGRVDVHLDYLVLSRQEIRMLDLEVTF